eukprot:SAG22_NODE_3644_length_1597_cov_2.304406_1_plen_411_part_10
MNIPAHALKEFITMEIRVPQSLSPSTIFEIKSPDGPPHFVRIPESLSVDSDGTISQTFFKQMPRVYAPRHLRELDVDELQHWMNHRKISHDPVTDDLRRPPATATEDPTILALLERPDAYLASEGVNTGGAPRAPGRPPLNGGAARAPALASAAAPAAGSAASAPSSAPTAAGGVGTVTGPGAAAATGGGGSGGAVEEEVPSHQVSRMGQSQRGRHIDQHESGQASRVGHRNANASAAAAAKSAWRCGRCHVDVQEALGKGPVPEGPATLCSACGARWLQEADAEQKRQEARSMLATATSTTTGGGGGGGGMATGKRPAAAGTKPISAHFGKEPQKKKQKTLPAQDPNTAAFVRFCAEARSLVVAILEGNMDPELLDKAGGAVPMQLLPMLEMRNGLPADKKKKYFGPAVP